jgi:putative cardiolipin synthase
MHNKSFTADNQVTIVGGRNVGDEYFGADTPVAFADLDVLALGAVVAGVSKSFDPYWNSESAYPAASLISQAPASAAEVKLNHDPSAKKYVEALHARPLVRRLLAGKLPLEWAPARVVSDDPAKVLTPPERTESHMLPRLQAALGDPARELDLVSPYFVPTKGGHGGAARDRTARREGARADQLARRHRRRAGARRLCQVPRAVAARRRPPLRAETHHG